MASNLMIRHRHAAALHAGFGADLFAAKRAKLGIDVSAAWKLKPFFMSIEIKPPSAFKPKTGLPVMTVMLLIAFVGGKCPVTISPNASLSATPF